MKPDIRIGVVGTGAIAQMAHLPVLRKMRGVNVVALCDIDRAKDGRPVERWVCTGNEINETDEIVPDEVADISSYSSISSAKEAADVAEF